MQRARQLTATRDRPQGVGKVWDLSDKEYEANKSAFRLISDEVAERAKAEKQKADEERALCESRRAENLRIAQATAESSRKALLTRRSAFVAERDRFDAEIKRMDEQLAKMEEPAPMPKIEQAVTPSVERSPFHRVKDPLRVSA